jgi:GntR family transcriptional regulator
MVYLRVDPVSGVPLGLQIERQLRLAVATGRLAPGEQLPPARDLAAQLHVNFHTVRKAYAELLRAGLLRSSRGRGTFVAARGRALTEGQLRAEIRDRLARLVEDLADAGADAGVLAAIVPEELAALLAGGEAPWPIRRS